MNPEPASPAARAHQALLQVLGEMWQQLDQFDNPHTHLALELSRLGGAATVRAIASYVDNAGTRHTRVGRAFPFGALPEILETTMLFRELQPSPRPAPPNP